MLTIAEMAIGLAGFSGVAVAFTRRGGFRQTDRFRFIALFSQALSVVVLAFVPIGFHHAGQVGPALWMGSSAVMLVVWVSSFWLLGVRFRPEFPADEQFSKQLSAVTYSPPILNVSLQVANLVGWPMESGALLYLAGLILYLMTAALLFAFLFLFGAKEWAVRRSMRVSSSLISSTQASHAGCS